MTGPGNLVTRCLPPSDTLSRIHVRDFACDTVTQSRSSVPTLRARVLQQAASDPGWLSVRRLPFHDRAPQLLSLSDWHARSEMASATLRGFGAPRAKAVCTAPEHVDRQLRHSVAWPALTRESLRDPLRIPRRSSRRRSVTLEIAGPTPCTRSARRTAADNSSRPWHKTVSWSLREPDPASRADAAARRPTILVR